MDLSESYELYSLVEFLPDPDSRADKSIFGAIGVVIPWLYCDPPMMKAHLLWSKNEIPEGKERSIPTVTFRVRQIDMDELPGEAFSDYFEYLRQAVESTNVEHDSKKAAARLVSILGYRAPVHVCVVHADYLYEDGKREEAIEFLRGLRSQLYSRQPDEADNIVQKIADLYFDQELLEEAFVAAMALPGMEGTERAPFKVSMFVKILETLEDRYNPLVGEICAELLRIAPNHGYGLYRMGANFCAHHNLQEGISHFQQALEAPNISPEDRYKAQLFLMGAVCRLQNGFTEGMVPIAEFPYNSVLVLNPFTSRNIRMRLRPDGTLQSVDYERLGPNGEWTPAHQDMPDAETLAQMLVEFLLHTQPGQQQ